MLQNFREGAEEVADKAWKTTQRVAVSRVLVPAAFGAAAFIGAHDFAHQNVLFDSLELAGGTALFTSSVADSFYRGKPSSLTLPLFVGLAGAAGSAYYHHNEYMTPAYLIPGALTFAGEKILGHSFSSKKSRRG